MSSKNCQAICTMTGEMASQNSNNRYISLIGSAEGKTIICSGEKVLTPFCYVNTSSDSAIAHDAFREETNYSSSTKYIVMTINYVERPAAASTRNFKDF